MDLNQIESVFLKKPVRIDENVLNFSAECPILWIRIDPDLKIIRELQFEQPDTNWQHELHYERDVLSQLEAIEALKRYPSHATRQTLSTVLDSSSCFYRVRMECAYVLSHVCFSEKFSTFLNYFSRFRSPMPWQTLGQGIQPRSVSFDVFSCRQVRIRRRTIVMQLRALILRQQQQQILFE